MRRRGSAGKGARKGKEAQARAGDGPGLLRGGLARVGHLVGLFAARIWHICTVLWVKLAPERAQVGPAVP